MYWIGIAVILMFNFMGINYIKHRFDKIERDLEAIKVVVYKDIKLKQ